MVEKVSNGLYHVDWLDGEEFATVMRAYKTGVPGQHARLDDIKNLIRANYFPPTTRAIRVLRQKTAELQAWIDKLTEEAS